MACQYAMTINICVDEKLFAWDEVQLAEEISDRVTTALQINFVNLLHEHALGGIYCSRDLVMEEYQGTGTGDDGPMLSDSELALMPPSLCGLGKGHPFVSTNKGIMATQTLVDMVKGWETQSRREGRCRRHYYRTSQRVSEHYTAVCGDHNVTNDNN
jgi:hypothetical protein